MATEAEIKQQLEEVKHNAWMAKREGQLLRLELRRELLQAQAQAALAAGKLTQQDIDNARAKYAAAKQEFEKVKSAGGISTRMTRTPANAAFRELREVVVAAREKAGVRGPR